MYIKNRVGKWGEDLKGLLAECELYGADSTNCQLLIKSWTNGVD